MICSSPQEQRLDQTQFSFKPITIASFPSNSGANPYLKLYCEAMGQSGIEFLPDTKFDLDWLRTEEKKIDAIHFHWPEFLWRQNNSKILRLIGSCPGLWRFAKYFSLLGSYKSRRDFRSFLKYAKDSSIKIIWTVHNIEPHEKKSNGEMQLLGALAASSDLIICHSQDAIQKCKSLWQPHCEIALMPHGNYEGVYPQPDSRKHILEGMNLSPTLPTVCCIGGIRQYKGVDLALGAIEHLNGQVQLIIAGAPHPSYSTKSIEKLARKLPHVHLIPNEITDSELANVISASEAVIMPYRKITGSGVLLTALTLSRGVITSKLPYFEEIIGNADDAGRLVSINEDTTVLAEAISDYLSVPASRRNTAARSVASKYDWNTITQPIAKKIRHLISDVACSPKTDPDGMRV